MPDNRSTALAYARDHHDGFRASLAELLAIPSISTLPENAADVKRAAEWLRNRLAAIGMQRATVFATPGLPIVYAEWLGAGNAPTVLIYGHYDVQPVDPLDLWTSPPFTPTARGDNLYCRGASDMKGQIAAALAAIESLTASGGLPVNVKWFLEGEEESGSPSLAPFVAGHHDLLKADCCLNADGGMLGPEMPTINWGLRGLAYFELRVNGPRGDLHSGQYGGAVLNPAQALAELIAGMHDAQGRVTLPGFYDAVRPLSAGERAEFARLPTNEAYYLDKTGAPALWGEAGYASNERIGARPTLEVNGLVSGFTGQGSKTVLPATAMAKLSMRLVPDQQPDHVAAGLRRYLQERAPAGVRWELDDLLGSPAMVMDRNSRPMQSLARALESVWATRPYYTREGGSVPVVGLLARELGIETAMTGFALPDDNIHAPNEKLHLPTWRRGIDALIHFLYNLAAPA
jgi:acetylornithine deacetylase/succinyl-diaminopimelate desuccinylase-like protein